MISNWLICGDCHGNFTWMTGTLANYSPENTAIIILGDVGFNFYLDSRDDEKKKEVNARGYHIYGVRGNHEARPQNTSCNYELVYDVDVKGEVYIQPEYPNLRFFKDWGIYQLGQYKVAVIGGAYSVDKWWRLQRVGVFSKTDLGYNNPKKTGWFPDEQLSTEEMAQAMQDLRGEYYDFVFTHTCPIIWQPTDLFLNVINQDTVDNSMELWLDELRQNINFKVWCFGHYHADRLERPYVEQYYNDVDDLDNIYARWVNYEKTGHVEWWLNKSPNFYMGV